MRIAPEGWPFILPGWALVAMGAWGVGTWGRWLWALEVVLLLLALWLIVFFRDPVRSGPRGERFVIAPADGKVVAVARVDEPMYLGAPATRLSIFMSVVDVHVNRYPVSGTVELVRYHPGGIRGLRGRVLVRQIAGLIARRIVTDGREGERVTQAERMGMIRFGSRVDVFLPAGLHPVVRVAPGDRVRAGASVLAEYPE